MKDDNATQAFKAMIKSLPLQGYETDCDAVLKTIDQYQGSQKGTEALAH